jgi:hypothetical protein
MVELCQEFYVDENGEVYNKERRWYDAGIETKMGQIFAFR